MNDPTPRPEPSAGKPTFALYGMCSRTPPITCTDCGDVAPLPMPLDGWRCKCRASWVEPSANRWAGDMIATGRTHWETCWQDITHGDCARARVARLQQDIVEVYTRAQRLEAERDEARAQLAAAVERGERAEAEALAAQEAYRTQGAVLDRTQRMVNDRCIERDAARADAEGARATLAHVASYVNESIDGVEVNSDFARGVVAALIITRATLERLGVSPATPQGAGETGGANGDIL
jgi:hypothetical protein